ncbi:MAG: hypothetical protein EXR48_02355 [Dehalococcoidia bacterium]|nr:hypothetical protein [Dehalococcoidia bacterium]
MPEAPDLQVIKEFLQCTLTGVTITEAKVLRPIVLRSLVPEDFATDIAGRAFTGFWRRGKLLGCELSVPSAHAGKDTAGANKPRPSTSSGRAGDGPDRLLVIHPMLSGALQHCAPTERIAAKTFLVFALSNGQQLRYLDNDQMGMVYYLHPDQLPSVPRLMEQGPDVLDEPLSLAEFKARLRPFRGEIKGVLTRGALVSSVGNAYTDEVCFAAGLFPFRRAAPLQRRSWSGCGTPPMRSPPRRCRSSANAWEATST